MTFTAIALARAAHREGGGAMAAYNAANEEAVDAFFAGDLSFLGIIELIAQCSSIPGDPAPSCRRGGRRARGGDLGSSAARELEIER